METCGLASAFSVAGETGEFRGYASIFGNLVDAHIPTVIERGAFKETLMDRKRAVKILYQHDLHKPIGNPLELRETESGLFARAKISGTQSGKEVLTLMRDGVLDALSIGFDPIKWEMEQKNGDETIRHIRELTLWEISILTFGADSKARIDSVHALPSFRVLWLADAEKQFAELQAQLGRQDQDVRCPFLEHWR